MPLVIAFDHALRRAPKLALSSPSAAVNAIEARTSPAPTPTARGPIGPMTPNR